MVENKLKKSDGLKFYFDVKCLKYLKIRMDFFRKVIDYFNGILVKNKVRLMEAF